MEPLTITPEMRNKLRAPLPAEAVKAHPTKTYLSSIKAIYVTERINDVFGVGSWQTRVHTVEKSDNGMVVVKLEFTIPAYNIYYECFGGNDNGGGNSKNFDLGDAYKGATTDALTKIGSWLEIGIDVFKGKNDPPNNKPKDPTGENKPADERPWLNKTDKAGAITKQWEGVEQALISGNYTIAQVETKYRLSKAIKTELQNIKPA